MKLFVTGIGTDVGKSVVSAILCERLKADYWKPVQAGDEITDSDTLRALAPSVGTVFPERYKLKKPASPHDAAKSEDVQIDVVDFELPETENHLVVEGAGGLMVPLNDKEMIADLIEELAIPVVLVASLYLGSINHTLLTINELERRKITIAGIIFNGEPNPESERVILDHADVPCVLRILPEEKVDQQIIKKYAQELTV